MVPDALARELRDLRVGKDEEAAVAQALERRPATSSGLSTSPAARTTAAACGGALSSSGVSTPIGHRQLARMPRSP